METAPKHILVDYGRRSYAFGLRWFIAEEDESARKAAINFVKKTGSDFDLFAERKGDYPQYAIAASNEGLKSGAISAAAVVADMMGEGSWLYVAEIQGTIWMTYGRDGRIMPQGDQVYNDVDEAKNAFEELEPTRWKNLLIPASWKDEGLVSGSVETSDITDIFQQSGKKPARLESLSSQGAVIKAVLAVAVLAGMGFGAYTLLAPGEQGPTPEELAAQTAEIERIAKEQQEATYAQLDANKPWQASPQAPQIITVCAEQLQSMPLQPAGYVYGGGECSNGSVTATYQRGSSLPTWLREWGQNAPEFQVNIDMETSDAFLTKSWEPLPERGVEELADYITMVQFLNESALLINGQMSYTQPIEYKYEEHPEYIPLYGVSDLTIITPQPQQWQLALERLPGIVINTVRIDTDGAIYTLEGQIYVKNR
jgi:Pilin accessory protein (PilO)